MPFIVKKNTISQTFALVQKNITNKCLTFPHVAFDSIPPEWIKNTIPTKIYFITDGKIGYDSIAMPDLTTLKNKLSESITKLFSKYNNIQLYIITAEPTNMDFTQIETMSNAAGTDVFAVVTKDRLTRFVSKFISYTPNNPNGFIHLNKNIPPPGFIPFGDKCFSELRIGEFIQYLSQLIDTTIASPNAENELLQIVQYLSSTLLTIIKDKPLKIADDIVKAFCQLFSKTTLDHTFVNFILVDAINREKEGRENVFASYRAQLRDLYREADNLLKKNVKDAVGIRDEFISLPIDNKIISGHFRLIDKNLTIGGQLYSQAGLLVQNINIGVLPANILSNSDMNNQCLRQWVRILINKLYGVEIFGDIVIYVVLALMLRVLVSDMPDKIKCAYRNLATIMLKKKRMNTDIMEISRLEAGELPIPNNGKIESFYAYMDVCNKILDCQLQPMTMWYAMCVALDNDYMINKQLIHCIDSIEIDFPGSISNTSTLVLDPNTSRANFMAKIAGCIKPLDLYEIPFENVLDYNCLITTDNVANVGGYMFLPHTSIYGSECSPVYVLSADGYNELIARPETSVCPICYTKLLAESFVKVGPKPESTDNIFSPGTIDMFLSRAPVNNLAPVLNSVSISRGVGANRSKIHVQTLSRTGTVVIMRGNIGSGKTIYANQIKSIVENRGDVCLIIGTAKYFVSNMTDPQITHLIRKELFDINNIPAETGLVIIIDECNEKTLAQNIFGFDFSAWKKVNYWPNLLRTDLKGYAAWTLRNVVIRPKASTTDNYYWNIVDTDIKTIVIMHKNKMSKFFGKKTEYLGLGVIEADTIMAKIAEGADAYQAKLDLQMPISQEIAKIESKIYD